ncbi:MAG: SAM-dependent chlorinase/fluorinase [Rhodothermus sp.]|nr:SAM-dependent chlorinase/fluorinase [Rhodothermus sp.]
MATRPQPLITLTTDFGTRDAYVAAMKGVLLGLAPQARLVDITHEIRPQDVMEAAFVLREAVPYFPPGTIHLVVVDPGVGTERRAVALRHHDHWFVGPDNGLFTLVLGTEQPDELVELNRPECWRTPTPSQTFHGRDIFAPVAGHLAAGRTLQEVGTPRARLTTLRWMEPSANNESILGWVVHVDRFGNCITNISRELFERYRAGRSFKCYVGSTPFTQVQPTYGAVAPGEALLLFGSSDLLEIAVNGGNAAELLGIHQGTPVHIIFEQKTTRRPS